MESPALGFRFAPSILVRLGEELVPNLDQAIIELIRNSYDADAKECTVEIKLDKGDGGTKLAKTAAKTENTANQNTRQRQR